MEWWLIVILFFGGLLLAFLSSIPIAIAFLLVDIVGMYFVIGPNFSNQLIGSIYDSVATFTLTPVPLFVLMGEVLFNSGLALKAIGTIDKWLGKIPGRLSVLSVVSGALFASLSGSTIANTAMLGSLLTPEMQRRNYHKSMIVGPIMASGSLAMMIPPSTLTVVFGSLAGINVGNLLIAGLLPGLLLAGLYAVYTIGRCWLNPKLAPAYEVEHVEFRQLLAETVKNVLPLGLVIVLTVGAIVVGLTTPTEAASVGTLISFLVAWFLGDMNKGVIKKSIMNSMRVTAMILIIVAASTAFSQVLAFSGATQQLMQLVTNLPLSPLWILVGMLAVVFLLGMFIEEVSIMMITLPIFMPIVTTMNIDPVWFGILMLLILEISLLTPPVGLLLYTIKGVTPDEITMNDIWKAAWPYVFCGLVAVLIILKFPVITMLLIS
ncbi:TRAP transporter large permease [Ferviditalea candida]|uniref:TRAP transporter large permease subunit n=1 Tax=Ferviditalea candida TaxID=3108399 RepID=A0ABU5ZLQ6_9BACL|nr:TRAP transporter large permease subunit [Paenibacillaceae bacterium T2]